MFDFVFSLPFIVLVAIVTSLLYLSIGLGYFTGNRSKKTHGDEVEKSISSISGSVLGLLAFIIAFTFGGVSSRYDTRKALVLEESNAIRNAWHRSDFLPDSIKQISRELIRQHVQSRLNLHAERDLDVILAATRNATDIQEQLWDLAMEVGGVGMMPGLFTQYTGALNDMANLHESRVIVGLYYRIPVGVWKILVLLVMLGMFLVGYQTAFQKSSWPWAKVLIALAFSLVLSMIASLDYPQSSFIKVSQFPLESLLEYIDRTM